MSRIAIAAALALLWQAAVAYSPKPVRQLTFKDVRAMERAGDLRNAIRFYELLARGGDGEAILRLGHFYEQGTPDGEIRPDKERAMRWYSQMRLYVSLPPRIEKEVAAWSRQQVKKSQEDEIREAHEAVAKAAKKREQYRETPAREQEACLIARYRWDEVCWGKDRSYLYKSSEECSHAAHRLNACLPKRGPAP